MDGAIRPELGLAIELRIAVRAALDADHMPEVQRLNSAADAAYARLRAGDAWLYRQWAATPEEWAAMVAAIGGRDA